MHLKVAVVSSSHETDYVLELMLNEISTVSRRFSCCWVYVRDKQFSRICKIMILFSITIFLWNQGQQGTNDHFSLEGTKKDLLSQWLDL